MGASCAALQAWPGRLLGAGARRSSRSRDPQGSSVGSSEKLGVSRTQWLSAGQLRMENMRCFHIS